MGKKIRVVQIIDVTERGRAGGKAAAANRTAEQRKALAQKAARARWEKVKGGRGRAKGKGKGK
jgi:hypothetical protein